MKKALLLSVLFLIVNGIVFGSDFRKTSWGMTKAQVKSAEVSTLQKELDNTLLYKSTLMGFDCIIQYNFAFEKLTSAKYIITNKRDDNNKYIEDYNGIKFSLDKKYGKSSENEMLWFTDKYRSEFNKWGEALAIGQMLIYSAWNTETTSIFYLITGDNNIVTHELEYYSNKLSKLEDRHRYKMGLKIFSNIGFRKSKWGNSKNYVKSRESATKVSETNDLLVYKKKIGVFDVIVSYTFTQNKLTEGKYYIANDYTTNQINSVHDYEKIKSVLISKYGKPSKDETIWKTDRYKDEYLKRGRAVAEGVLILNAEWNTKNSIIILNLSGVSDEINLALNYKSVKYKDFKANYEQKKALKDL